MNPEHEIYKAALDEIPAEDTARLDGYLAAKSEETELKRAQRKFEEQMRALKAKQ